MSKHEKAEKTKETHTDTHKEGHKDASGAHASAGGVDAKKAPEHKKPESSPQSKGKGHTPMPGGCFSWHCKRSATRFNFCEEHYDHFKFGLIKKTGEPVVDYEKKIEHYTAYKAKQGARKVA